jgi:Uma2 family endonuclease
MSVPAALKFTYEDYALLPEDRRYEVIDGELFPTPAPTLFHQAVSERIGHRLREHLRRTGAGVMFYAPCDVVLSTHDVVQPDILVVTTERRAILSDKFVAGAPDLIVEVLSPSTESRDRVAKAKRYAAFGVREMWLVDPAAKTIEVLVNAGDGFRRDSLDAEGDTVRSAILSGLEFPAAPVFRPI